MTTILAFLIGTTTGLCLGAEVQKRVRAERNFARLQRDLAEQDRDRALTGNVLVFDPVSRTMRRHPAGTRIPQQDQR